MEKTKVVCMGDSITEGFGVDLKDAYPSKLQVYLGEKYQVYNQGVCSCTVSNIMLGERQMGLPYAKEDRYKKALEIQGDIYVILLGTNDAQDGIDDVEDVVDPYLNMISRKDEFTMHYQAIIDSIRVAAPNAKIFMGLPAPVQKCIWRRHQEKYLQMLMPYYEQLAKQNPDIQIIDVHQAFMDLGDENRLDYYLEDMLHPNPKGLEVIARTVCEAIVNN